MITRDEQVYAQLPEELLTDILESTPQVTKEVKKIFEKIENERENLRKKLKDKGLIRNDTEFNEAMPTLAAVDGGSAVEKSVGVDTILSVAVGIEGLNSEPRHWETTQYSKWQKIVRHDELTPRLARGAMTMQEMNILVQAPHDFRIMDGSHKTPVIALNSLLVQGGDRSLLEAVVELVEEFKLEEGYIKLNSNPQIISMQKYDSSSHLAREVLDMGDALLDDRTVLSFILEPGEFIDPQTVPKQPWRDLRINVDPILRRAKSKLYDAIQEGIDPLKQRKLYFTYYKPTDWSPAYQVELKPQIKDSKSLFGQMLVAIKSQVISPDIREPYPQFMADQMAKSVGNGLEALRAAVRAELSYISNPKIVSLITFSYRTEGT